jgi:hypothetical protein
MDCFSRGGQAPSALPHSTVAILVQAVWAIALTLSDLRTTPRLRGLRRLDLFGLTVATLFFYRRKGSTGRERFVRLGISCNTAVLHPDRDLRRLGSIVSNPGNAAIGGTSSPPAYRSTSIGQSQKA